jgi:glycosyltransferase involved in cell wall biosynthesis
MKKKILHVYKSFYPETIGGIEKFIDDLTHNLSKKYDFSLLCLGSKTKIYKYKNIKIYKFKKDFEIASCPFSFEAFINFKKISAVYDLIHYHFPFPYMDFLSFLTKKKSIVTYHSDIIRQKFFNFFYFPLRNFFISNQTYIIATSKNYLNTSKLLKKNSKKVKIIPFGLKVNSKVKINYFSNPFILFVGTLRYYKGLNVLMRAAKFIKCNIYICGNGEDFKKLKNMKTKNKLRNVFFLGRISEQKKINLLKKCFAFVFPSNSRSEAFGIAMLEAMSFGKPLISCKINSGTSYINKNNLTGFEIRPNDPYLLAKKINFLLNKKNFSLYKKFSRNSYVRFKSKFHILDMVRKYDQVYKSILK